jgi:hypothetical protein
MSSSSNGAAADAGETFTARDFTGRRGFRVGVAVETRAFCILSNQYSCENYAIAVKKFNPFKMPHDDTVYVDNRAHVQTTKVGGRL